MRAIQSTSGYCCQHCFKNFKRDEIVAHVKKEGMILCQICTNQLSNISIELRIYNPEDDEET